MHLPPPELFTGLCVLALQIGPVPETIQDQDEKSRSVKHEESTSQRGLLQDSACSSTSLATLSGGVNLPVDMTDTTPKPSIPAYKADFLQACITGGVLKFGTFELKSKRISPYFFNAGLFHRADLLRSISTAYAQSIREFLSRDPLQIDVLFGPAYKGIPLATATVDKLAQIEPEKFGSLSYSFNRKEVKDHGEGGNLVGASFKGKKVMIVDDVISSGKAIREGIEIIGREGGELVAIIVALDRMEKMPSATDDDGKPRPSAIGEVGKEYGVPVLSIITLDDLIEALKGMGTEDDIGRLEEYKARYQASD